MRDCEAISPRAEPKSISTGEPSLRTMMLSGAMSRCRKSAAWMISSASSSGAIIVSSSACRGARLRPLSQALKLPPSSNFSTM